MTRRIDEHAIPYENRLVLWARRRAEARHMDARAAKIAIETGVDLPHAPEAPIAAIPGDPALLRGIPVVGVHGGYGGAIRDTRPGAGLD